MTGLSRFDPILRDIRSAIREGHFDRQVENGPSELTQTPVEELLERVELMSPTGRRIYLDEISDMRTNPRTLSGTKEQSKRPIARWLSKS